MEKPFSIRVEDFKISVISAIEDSALPPSVRRLMLSEIFRSVIDLEKRQYAEDLASWQKNKEEEH